MWIPGPLKPSIVFRRWNEQRKAMGLSTFNPTLTYHMRAVEERWWSANGGPSPPAQPTGSC
jgi:hypothetical protein